MKSKKLLHLQKTGSVYFRWKGKLCYRPKNRDGTIDFNERPIIVDETPYNKKIIEFCLDQFGFIPDHVDFYEK